MSRAETPWLTGCCHLAKEPGFKPDQRLRQTIRARTAWRGLPIDRTRFIARFQVPQADQNRGGYRNFKRPFSRILNLSGGGRSVKQRSNAFPPTEPPPFSQHCFQRFVHTRPISTAIAHLHGQRSNAFTSAGQASPVLSFPVLRRLKQIHPSCRRARWRLGGQPQMREDAGDGGRFFDGRDQLQLATTVRAVLYGFVEIR
jgi:hypothetical protein